MGSLYEALAVQFLARKTRALDQDLPADMSTMSLAGGGLIAGDALASLAIGVNGLLRTMLQPPNCKDVTQRAEYTPQAITTL